MLKKTSKQLSLYSILYDKIPKNHILKVINKAGEEKGSGLIIETLTY